MKCFYSLLFFQTVVLCITTDSCTSRTSPFSTLLPSDVQATVQLEAGQAKTLFYVSQIGHAGAALSVTLVTCAAPVEWSLLLATSSNGSHFTTTEGIDTFHVANVEQGMYRLWMRAPGNGTAVQVYVSTEKGGPQTLQQQNGRLRVARRQKRKRLTVKWNPSMVDPQCTDYCLVVSTEGHSPSLCAAQRSKIVCTGRRTHYTLPTSLPSVKYYFDLFATNNQSNFTYPYGALTYSYTEANLKPTSLKDGKATYASLKKLDGKAVFRYKVGRKALKTFASLQLFILPCGGVVDVEITLKNQLVVKPQRVEGFRKIEIKDPVVGGRYHIKVFGSLNHEEEKKSSGVEIYATTKPKKIPLPAMPAELAIREYSSMTTCHSITVGWMVVPSARKAVTYCVIAKEGVLRDAEEHRMPNQCGLESRLRKSADYAVKYCKDVKYDKEEVALQEIGNLKPGKSYIIQVTVKKAKGKTLSYDLLQAATKSSCKYL